jgi:DNA-binding winged helix-turn-helix (wHTH) protein
VIGRYIYCTKERFIYLDGEPVHIEPKMAELLDYLLLHTERYVPLQELHDEVWSGRIVTDTAVRRVISRVRALIEEEPSKPVIIKSLPKRGYRLFATPAAEDILEKTVCNQNTALTAQYETEQAVTLGLAEEQVAALIKNTALKGSEANKASKQSFTVKLVLMFFFLVFTVAVVLTYHNKPAQLEPDVDTIFDVVNTEHEKVTARLTHLDSLPLNTRMITLSQNGELALYEKQLGNGVLELYLHQINQAKQWLIASNTISTGYGVFVENDKALLLSFNSGSSSAGGIQLWRLDDTQNVSSKQVFIDNIQGATSVTQGDKPNSAYVSVTSQIKGESKSEYYYLYWNNNGLVEKKQVTSSNNGLSLDIYGVLSPNKQYLAYVRKTRLDHEQELQVLELASGKLTKRLPWPQEVRGLVWQDTNILLVLNKQSLTRLNFTAESKAELLVNFYGKFWQLHLLNNKVLLYQREALNHRYIESVILDDTVHSIQRERPPTSVAINISKKNSQQWFEVTKVGTQYYLDIIDLEDPEKGERIFSSDEYFYMLDESAAGEVLLRVGDRVGILKSDGSVDYINSEQQIVDDAVFDRDGINIIYSEIINNVWSISFYDRSSQNANLIREGVMSVRVSDEYYVFWSDSGQLFKAKTLAGELEILPAKGKHFFSPMWGMAYPNVVWLDYISSKIVLTKFNLITHKTTVLDTDNIQGLGFSLSHDGKTLVLDGVTDATSKLYYVENIH